MNKIKQKIDDYLGFDSNTIFAIDHIRLFGGAIRDILADQPIQDLDILLGPESCQKVKVILEMNGYDFIENYISKDLGKMYKDIHIINEPLTFMRVVNNKISMVQLIRPSRIQNGYPGIIPAIMEIIWNVDLSCCGVSYDGKNLYENIPNAVLECKSMIFTPIVGSSMHSPDRSLIRKEKLISRGWTESDSPESHRKLRLEMIVPEEQIYFIREYQGDLFKPKSVKDEVNDFMNFIN